MKNKLNVFTGIGELLTLQGVEKKAGRRIQEEDLTIVPDGLIAASEGRIVWVGPRHRFDPKAFGEMSVEEVDLNVKTVLPGFVECHTHSLFAGSRAHEFEWRMQGQSYQEIAAKGGGILSTVKATRAASADDLRDNGQKRVNRFLEQGVTTLEIKSGYGLDLSSEIKLLEVARQLKGPEIVTTFLGPHSRSPDFPDLDSYMTEVIEKILPEVAKRNLADRADIYIEKGFFEIESARRYFAKVKSLGLPITAHVEQLSLFGGTNLALEFEPQSVDHVVFIEDETARKLASLSTVAVLLPASDLYLKMQYPRARALIDQGVRVALSTDFNPGTSPTQDLSLIGVLARLEMKMSLPEVIAAWTFNAACALGKGESRGVLAAGKCCDFICLDGSWQDLFYSVGHHPVQHVVHGGKTVAK